MTAAGSCTARGIAWRCSTEVNELARPCAAVGVKGGRLALESCAVGSASALSGVNAQRGATLSLLRVTGANCRHTGVLLSGAGTTATLKDATSRRTARTVWKFRTRRKWKMRYDCAARTTRCLGSSCRTPGLHQSSAGGPVAEPAVRRLGPVRRGLRRVGRDVLEKRGARRGAVRGQVERDFKKVRLRRSGRPPGLLQRRRFSFAGCARDCCYEPGDDDSPRLEAGL